VCVFVCVCVCVCVCVYIYIYIYIYTKCKAKYVCTVQGATVDIPNPAQWNLIGRKKATVLWYGRILPIF